MPWYLRNKYALSTLAFAVWMAFVDENNLILQWRLSRELGRLQKDKSFYENEIAQTRADLDDLLSDNGKLEKFARERYFMKHPSDEIFVFVEAD